MRRLCILLYTTVFCVGVALAESSLAGPWNGEIRVNGQVLPLVVHITDNDNGLEASLDSPLQGATDIPASISVNEEGAVEIDIALIGARFSGKYGDERIAGSFSQAGVSFPLVLKPGEYEVPRPQTPRPPFPYVTENVTFVNPTDSAMLVGTLTLPVNYNLPMIKNVPLVVMVTGSGQQNRDEEIMRHRPFAVLAHKLALNGIASLRYDDRGFGESTGDVVNATTATFASDARAAVNFAKAKVNKVGDVGVLGHSEGGTVAYMLGASGDADFIVSLAGPAVSGAEILKAQNRALLSNLYPPVVVDEYVQVLDIVFDYITRNLEAKEFNGLDSAISHLTSLPTELKQNLHQILANNSAWLSYFIAYNPAETIAAIDCPVFAINGRLDIQVDATTNSEALQNRLPENAASVVREYPGLNHMFQHATTGLPSEYGQIDETMSEEVIADIINWINGLVKKHQ